MNIDEFIRANRCEQLYHISEKGSWPNIQRLGLLSTSALLDICNVTDADRFKIESNLRPKKIPIKHPVYGDIYVRDQDPMKDRPSDGIALANLLHPGTSIREWFKFLNLKTFFWVSEYEFKKMLCARLYRHKPHWVLKVDTLLLLKKYADKACISDQNSGSLYSKKLRGPTTFISLLKCPVKNNIMELTVDYGIPDIEKYTLSVTECIGSYNDGERICQQVKRIWP